MNSNRAAIVAAVATVACVLPTGSCSSVEGEAPQPSSSSVASPQPTVETTLERRTRLDQQAAVRAYRAALAEVDRLFVAGGASTPTPKLRAVTTGEYLQFTMRSLRKVKENDWHGTGVTTVVFVGAQGWSKSAVHLKSCEDLAKARLLDRQNKDRTPPGDRRYVQDYTIIRTSSGWKVSNVESRPVASFETYGCAL